MYAAIMPERPLPKLLLFWLAPRLVFSVTMFRSPAQNRIYGSAKGGCFFAPLQVYLTNDR
jgi:hypothetical protein